MNATVDLVVDSSTNTHSMEVVFGTSRFPLSPEEAAKLSADLCTVLAFSMSPADSVKVPTQASAVAVVDDDPDEEDEEVDSPEEDHKRPLAWHRKGSGTSKYEANMDGTKVETFRGRKGWNIKIGGKLVNDAPISTKSAALELVEKMRVSA